MIHTMLRIKLTGSNLNSAVKVFRLLLERTLAIHGCFACNLYQDLIEQNALMIEQSWQSWECLEKYLRSESYKQILLVMENAVEPPEVRFYTVSGSGGMEIIERARTK